MDIAAVRQGNIVESERPQLIGVVLRVSDDSSRTALDQLRDWLDARGLDLPGRADPTVQGNIIVLAAPDDELNLQVEGDPTIDA